MGICQPIDRDINHDENYLSATTMSTIKSSSHMSQICNSSSQSLPFCVSSSSSSSYFNHILRLTFVKRKSINWTLKLSSLLILMLSSSMPNLSDACQFPVHWTGNWFHKGIPDPIRILNGNISEKGICRESNGEKFLIENRSDKCVKCMVINERHHNLLQYKESFSCHSLNDGKISLESVCSEINGDAPLYSLFRLDTRSVPCPFHGPFTFSYNRGQGECEDPISTIESCTDDHHLLFRFQACADVYGSESRVEELECFAEWKEGSFRYLVGKLHHHSAKTDEDKFRCFVFDKIKDEPEGYEIAQSGDATCDGLLTPKDGSRTMKIHKTLGTIPRCQFPHWLTVYKHWKSLDGSHMYDFNRQNNSFLVYNITNGGDVVRNGMCIHQENITIAKDAFNISQFVVHFTSGCKSGFECMRIYQRSNQIIEVQYGTPVNQQNDACSSVHFKQSSAKYITLTTMASETQECPFEGIYAVNVPDGSERPLSPSNDKTLFICSEQSSLNSRCNSYDHMQLQSRCSYNDATRNFRCRGGWDENGTHYLIASSNEDDIRQYCLVYNENENGLQMTISSATCLRHEHNYQINNHLSYKDSHVALRLVNKGLCSQSSGTSSSLHIINGIVVLKQMLLGLFLLFAS